LGLPFPAQHSYDLDFSDDSTNGAIILDYAVSDEVMVYASASTGYKAGGFVTVREAAGPLFSANAACSASDSVAIPGGSGLPTIYACDPRDPRFGSETVNAYELGIRSRLFGRKLQLNLTGFYADYSDLQLNVFDGFSFIVRNAGSAVTQGAELETIFFTPVQGLQLALNLAYTDASFGSEVPALQAGEPALAGEPLQNAPEWAGAATLDYAFSAFGRFDSFVRAEYSFTSSQFSSTRIGSLGEALEIDSFELLNLSAGVELGKGLQVSAFCRNCLDERYANFYANAVAQPGSKEAFVGNPREFGLTVMKRFDP
jgi:outer membrane receptor protein involved in Fe transport